MSALLSTGYVMLYVDRRQILEHRYVWEQAHGPIPEGWEVHHWDRNPSNNEISNLQAMTRAEHHAIHTRLPRVRSCAWCGKDFEPDVNNRGQTEHCSRSCGQRTAWAKRRQGIRSVRPR